MATTKKFAKILIDGGLIAWTGNTGTVDASTLGFPPGLWPHVIWVKSPRTGAEVSFVFQGNGNAFPTVGYASANLPGFNLTVFNS